MDPVVEYPHADRSHTRGASPAAPEDVDRIVRETRQQFVGAFAAQCERIAAVGEAAGDGARTAIAVASASP